MPRKNPFPRKSVAALEGAAAGPLYTLVTPQIARAREYALEYWEDGLGQVISVSGPYGSGKSHLVDFARKAVAQAAAADSTSRRHVQIYQKAANADFISFYQDLIEQIGLPILQEVNDRFLGLVATREMTSESEEAKRNALLDLLPEDMRKEAKVEYESFKTKMVERVRADPGIVYKYLDNLIIQPEAVYDQRAAEVQSIAGENFKKAFFYLRDPALEHAAYKWFTVDELTADEVARLGVSGRLTTAEDAKYALFLLVTLFHSAGIRLFIYFDQIEKLLIGTDPKTRDENRGVLFGLAEICPREDAFLALVGADDGWAAVREDLWTRIGSTQIRLGQIPAAWGRLLLDVYLNERESCEVKKEIKEPDIAPFSVAAADEMLRISRGNVRLFLQICHDVFKLHDDTAGELIGSNHVKEAIAQQIDEGSVAAQIQSILTGRNLTFDLQAQLSLNFKPDIVVGDPSRPLAIIEIVNPLFYVDEAETAVEIANQKQELSGKYPGTRIIIVSIGYASAEVEERLERIVDHYLVYQHQSFGEHFGTVLDSLPVYGQGSKGLSPELESEVSDSLQQLLAAREKEISDLNERLQALSEQQKAEALPRQQEWRAWLRADQEKWEQRAAELDAKSQQERTHLQEAGEKKRLRKLTIYSSIYAIPSLILTTLLSYFIAYRFYLPFLHSTFEFYKYFWLSFVGLVLYLVFIYYATIYRRLVPLGFKTSEIGNYTGELSQLILRARTTSISGARARVCLKNSNPLIRYFGALVFLAHGRDDTSKSSPPELTNERKPIGLASGVPWSRLAAIEGWKPLYLAYLQMAFREEDEHSIQRLFDLLVEANADDPRIVYLISTMPEDRAGQLDFQLTGVNAASPAYARVVSHALIEGALNRATNWRKTPAASAPLAQFAQAFTGSGFQYPRRSDALSEWFKQHGQFWHRELKETVELDLTEPELISIIEALSPHRESGLASFRDLPISTLYLRLYRFFAEIQWRFEQGDVILKQ
jgi:hypothetical protein